MSKQSNKPFYVDVGTSIVAIRCASNHDILWRRDHDWHGKGVIDEAERICARMNDEVAPAATGNVAALREFAEYLANYPTCEGCEGKKDSRFCESCPKGVALAPIALRARMALSAPPRNCDRFADETDTQIAFLNEVWLISVTKETALERDRFENWTDEMRARYAKWLLAPATEQEGGAE